MYLRISRVFYYRDGSPEATHSKLFRVRTHGYPV